MQVVADPPEFTCGKTMQKVIKATERDVDKTQSRDDAWRKTKGFHKTLEIGKE